MVGQRVGHRALVAVVGRQVEHLVEVRRKLGEDPVVGDRALDEVHARIVRQVLPLGRQEVVHDERGGRIAGEQRPYEVAADESRAADDEYALALVIGLGHSRPEGTRLTV